MDKDKNKNNDDKYPKQQKLPMLKIKLDIDYETKDVKTIVFNDPEQTPDDDENVEPQLVEGIKTIDDLSKHVMWKGKYTFILMLNKLWAAKSADEKGIRSFGVTFKLLQVGINAMPTMNSSAKQEFTSQALTTKCYDSDDDDEEEVVVKTATKNSKKDKKVAPKKAAKKEEPEEEEDADEDEEEEEDESEEEEEDKKAASKKTTSKKEESEEEEEESEEEEEESEEEEVVIATKSNKPNKSTAAKKKR
jgi:hypothetical protein